MLLVFRILGLPMMPPSDKFVQPTAVALFASTGAQGATIGELTDNICGAAGTILESGPYTYLRRALTAAENVTVGTCIAC